VQELLSSAGILMVEFGYPRRNEVEGSGLKVLPMS